MEIIHVQKEIEKETSEIYNLIQNTKSESWENVKRYHKGIIERLDSEKYISVPSFVHFNLQQLIWIAGRKASKNLSWKEAESDFINSPHRQRFNAWYSYEYIFKRRITEPWEKKVVKEGSRYVFEKFNHPLAEVWESELLD